MEIRFGRPEDMTAAAERLTHEQFFPVCSPTYQSGAFDPDTARLFDCAGLTGSWGTWFNSQGKAFARDGQVNLTSTFVIALEAALYGAGICMAHATLTDALAREGRLVRPFEHAPLLSEAHFLFPAPPHATTPASRAFEEWLREELAAQSNM